MDWRWLWQKLCDLFWKLMKYFGINRSAKQKILHIDKVPKKIVAGYFLSGSLTSANTLSKIDPRLLTHLYYAFLEVQNDGTLRVQNQKVIQELDIPTKLMKLKKQNPHLKILFSCVSKDNSFSVVVRSRSCRRIFVRNAVMIIQLWGFDGLDIDWEFPKSKDKESFLALLKELRVEFDKHKFLLTAAVRAIPIYGGSGYDVAHISKILDVINIMTYDYYGGWSNHTGFNSPLYPSSLDSEYERKYLNVESSVRNWVQAGADKDKICIGIPFYGRSFTLRSETEHGLHAHTMGTGTVVSPTYYEITKKYTTWNIVRDNEQMGVYKYRGNQWIGYDDRETIKKKIDFVLQEELAGIFIWQIAGDDITGEVSGGVRQYLLYSIYRQIIENETRDKPPPRIPRYVRVPPGPETLTDMPGIVSTDASTTNVKPPSSDLLQPNIPYQTASEPEVNAATADVSEVVKAKIQEPGGENIPKVTVVAPSEASGKQQAEPQRDPEIGQMEEVDLLSALSNDDSGSTLVYEDP